MINWRRLYNRIRYRKQLKQGFGTLEQYGTKTEVTDLLSLGLDDYRRQAKAQKNRSEVVGETDK